MALLALRASVTLALLIDILGQGHGMSQWVEGAGLLLSVAVCAGYLTPVAAVMALVFHVLIWWLQGIDSAFVASIVLLDALALALLGPGAYSVDSYRFGRRVVVLPPR
ncbi:hypothetical protein [Variovorax sp. GT1P44]|uniref:hypothetical protein n=1 Tax=Variovorax sp. GT1P44 TaxID=3443742 RepID=UPI003F484956